ncbi:unnamed protein product, partial [Ectocarpus fasciculatus]
SNLLFLSQACTRTCTLTLYSNTQAAFVHAGTLPPTKACVRCFYISLQNENIEWAGFRIPVQGHKPTSTKRRLLEETTRWAQESLEKKSTFQVRKSLQTKHWDLSTLCCDRMAHHTYRQTSTTTKCRVGGICR